MNLLAQRLKSFGLVLACLLLFGSSVASTLWAAPNPNPPAPPPPPVVLPTVQFASPTYSVSESGTSIDIEVTLSAPSAQAVTVKYAVTGGTATAGTDFTVVGDTLTFAATTPTQAGETSKTFYRAHR